MIVPTSEQLLDLHVAQRSATFRFDLLDAGLNEIGSVLVAADNPPTIENNTNRTIKRQMTGMVLHPSDAAAVNPMTDRLRASMILADGIVRPLGVFLFSGFDRKRTSYGLVPSPTLHDQGAIIDQPVPNTVMNPPGSLVTDMLAQHLDGLPLPAGLSVETSGARTSLTSAMTWPAGTSRATIVNETAAVAGFYSGYFDAAGVYTFRSPSPAGPDDPPDMDYDRDVNPSRIVADTIVVSDDLLDAPNRYIVVDS